MKVGGETLDMSVKSIMLPSSGVIGGGYRVKSETEQQTYHRN